MPEIICNTSPLQYLHQLGKLDILHSLVGNIVAPVAAVSELDTGRRIGIDLPDVAALEWVTIRRPAGAMALPPVLELGTGETEVLMLALESPGAIVILDDNHARFVAQTIGIKVTGTLGILRDAKRAGIVPAISPLIDKLQGMGFRLAPHTKLAILKQTGEVI